MSKSPDRAQAEYWQARVFRNSYTYRGRRRFVPGWHLKIQWQGQRRTLRLTSTSRDAAAQEAARLYRSLQEGGWSAVERRTGTPATPPRTAPAAHSAGAIQLSVAPRKYVSSLESDFERQLFATVSDPDACEHIPLGTEQMQEAQLRARDLRAELERQGWDWLRLAHPREATVSVFWKANPMTCTYTTLLSRPGHVGEAPAPSRLAKGWRIVLIEPDGGVRRALRHWLLQAPSVAEVQAHAQTSEVKPRVDQDLILANREQPGALLRDHFHAARVPLPRLLTHGVFADSDAIFASFSGVSEGYLLRRVPPADLLAPLVPSFPDGPPSRPAEADRAIARYFQALFELSGTRERPQPAELTLREHEVLDLLCRGFVDKEVAAELGISIWTVHSHLKRIFTKYGVRTRTEAVVRHLQK